MTDLLQALNDRKQRNKVPSLQPSTRGAVSRSDSRDHEQSTPPDIQEQPAQDLPVHIQPVQDLPLETVPVSVPIPVSADSIVTTVETQRPINCDEPDIKSTTTNTAIESRYRLQKNNDIENMLPRGYSVRYEELFEPLRSKHAKTQITPYYKNNGDQRNYLSSHDNNAASSVDDICIDYTSFSLSPKRRINEATSKHHFYGKSNGPTEFSEDTLRELPTDLYGSQEDVMDYRVGGYKPVTVGEELGDYTVLRKLGYGHFSTVWLCSDRRERQKYVAVKVVQAVHTCDSMAREEIKLLNQLINIDAGNPGRKHIIEMLDYFQVNSINGKHVCIAFELMGPSLLHLITQSQFQGIYQGAVKSIIKQVLTGLCFLHNKCKIIHTDLKPENILIKVNDVYIQNMVDKAKRYEELGVPMPRSYITSATYDDRSHENHPDYTRRYSGDMIIEGDKIMRCSSFPKLADLTIDTDTKSRKSKNELYVSPKIEVKIADLGNACWQHEKITGTIQTEQYRALEVLLDTEYDIPADIWSVGCIAFELATGEFLFNPRKTHHYSSTEDHVLLIYELLGGVPPYIASRGRRSRNFFDANGELALAERDQLHIWKTEDVLVDKYEWKRVDAIPFSDMINGMIEPDPELRINAETALTHHWLNDPL